MNNTKSISKNTVRKNNDNTFVGTKAVKRDEVIFKKKLEKVNDILSKTALKK